MRDLFCWYEELRVDGLRMAKMGIVPLFCKFVRVRGGRGKGGVRGVKRQKKLAAAISCRQGEGNLIGLCYALYYGNV